MKKLLLSVAALAMMVSANAALDVPAGHTGGVQVIMEDGATTSGHYQGGVDAGGFAQLTGDFIIAAGNTSILGGGITDMTTDFTYCVIKMRLAAGKTVADIKENETPRFRFGIALYAQNYDQKKDWSEWTDGTNPVPTPTNDWQNIVFAFEYIGNDWIAEPFWTRISFESFAAGIIEIEDIWFTTTKPNFGAVGIATPEVAKEKVSVEYFSVLGVKVSKDTKGLVIEKTIYADGTSSAQKVVKK